MDKVEGQILGTKNLFITNIRKSQEIMAADFVPRIPQAAHKFAIDYIRQNVFCNSYSRFRPSPEDVVNAIKKHASVGLPDPTIRKGSKLNYVRYIISIVQTEDLNLRKFVISDPFFTPLTGAFLRSQITDSGLKARLVFAVSFGFVIIETYFNLCIKNIIINCDSCAVHG
jgi:hypothetical protein